MWMAMESGEPGMIAGISAFPSIHVAISLWIFLTVRTLAPRGAPLALAYFFLISLASVLLGWHYISDGVGGAIGMIAIWRLAAIVERSSLLESACANARSGWKADIFGQA